MAKSGYSGIFTIPISHFVPVYIVPVQLQVKVLSSLVKHIPPCWQGLGVHACISKNKPRWIRTYIHTCMHAYLPTYLYMYIEKFRYLLLANIKNA